MQLLRAALAKERRCGEALTVARNLGSEVPGLAFTRDGLEPILQSARTRYLLGTVFAGCGETVEAKARFELASAASAPTRSSGLGWRLKNCQASIPRNGTAACKPLWSRLKIAAALVPIPVGGNIPPHPWQRNSARPLRRTLDFERLCCCRTECWHIT